MEVETRCRTASSATGEERTTGVAGGGTAVIDDDVIPPAVRSNDAGHGEVPEAFPDAV